MIQFDDEARNNLIILFTAFFLALGGIIIIYVKCDRSRTKRVREISDLIKTYISYKNEKERVNVLENRLTKSLEKDL